MFHYNQPTIQYVDTGHPSYDGGWPTDGGVEIAMCAHARVLCACAATRHVFARPSVGTNFGLLPRLSLAGAAVGNISVVHGETL